MRFFCSLILLFQLSINLQAQDWTWKNPLPQGNPLFNIEFLNNEIGIAVGGNGTIIKTCDSGNKWEVLKSGEIVQLTSCKLIDEQTYFVVGWSGRILKTRDGGRNWEKMNSGTNQNLLSISFTNQITGYVSGWNGTILKTIDGGENWTKLRFTTSQNINAIVFINADTGFAVGAGGLVIKTTNAGETWENLDSEINSGLNSVFFVSQTTGFAAGDYGTILKTTNGGGSWMRNPVYTNTSESFYSIFFTDQQNGFAVAGFGTLARTSDGGNTWDVDRMGNAATLTSVFFTDATSGYLVSGRRWGEGGMIYRTLNAGETWDMLSSETHSTMTAVFFPSQQRGCAVGWSGTILTTDDGGENWETRSFNKDKLPYTTVHFPSENIGYIGGWSGVILKTTNGGQDWRTLPMGTNQDFYSVYFVDEEIGFAGGKGILYKTTDGGSEWKQQYNHPTASINSVCFANQEIGFAVGGVMYGDWPVLEFDGLILKTTDGGITWNENRNPEWPYFQDIQIIDENQIFLLGGEKLFKTTDGGDSWTARSFTSSDPFLMAIHFLDEKIGFAVDGSGSVKTTINGGINWKPWATPCTFMMNDVFFTSPENGCIVGSNGALLKTGQNSNFINLEDERPTPQMRIMPNPARDHINIQFQNVSFGANVSVYNISGKLMSKQTIYNRCMEIDLRTFPPGVYLVKMTDQDMSEVQKILIQ